jgi:hypothetical protein
MPEPDGYRPPGTPPPAARTLRGQVGDDVRRGLDAVGLKVWEAAKGGGAAAVHHPAEFTPLLGGALTEAACVAQADVPDAWMFIWSAVILAGILLYQIPRSRKARERAASRMRRAYYTAAYAAVGICLAIAGLAGAGSPLALQAVGSATVAATGTWWARHAKRRLRARKRPAPEPEVEASADPHAALRAEITEWFTSRYTHPRGPLAGARLIGEVEANDLFCRLHVQVDGDTHTFGNIYALADRMVASRGTSLFNIQIEPTVDQRRDQGVITIFHKNPLPEQVPFPGPTIDTATGCATVGRCADLSPALIRFWQPGSGAWHELVSGGSGTGKSRYLDQALINERHALDEDGQHLIVSWICDPQMGQSLPDWQDKVDRFARTPGECIALIQDAHAEMLARNDVLSKVEWTDRKGRIRKGKDHFTPSAAMPLLSVTVEESPMLLRGDRRFKVYIKEILSMGRKCGVRLRLITQIPSIAELGNDFAIRPLLASMSVVCLRTTEPITGTAIPGLPGDPKNIEEFFPDGTRTFGLGYILGAVKASKMRTFTLDDLVVYDWASAGTTAHLTRLAQAPAADAEPAAQAGHFGASAPAAASAMHFDSAVPAQYAEALGARRARDAICAYVNAQHFPVTSGQIVRELGLANSAVSQAIKRELSSKAPRLAKVSHGLYAAPGRDTGFWQAADRTSTAA